MNTVPAALVVDELRLDLRSGKAGRAGEPVVPTRNECRLLADLPGKRRRIVTRAEITTHPGSEARAR